MATLSVQTSVFGGLAYTLGSASTADKFANDGRTMLIFLNSNASSRTLTFAANDATKPGFGTIATPDTVITLPGSGTNGGRYAAGPFPVDRFNDVDGNVNYTLSDATGMTVAAVKLTNYR
ncbi:hypothetical protein [Tautonia plasticadhaerens]|uniref:Uncharacterized protein n=1 Tax=Tautonia plasticadhaerens TaxID=2527974 RepID=A0A518H229_9BACT|nr:hypothetical protein [Tautonia plasticadhaerens]QDV34901.1 hypothetical protein ElP_27980 [Tautonia plasticadhaerens]